LASGFESPLQLLRQLAAMAVEPDCDRQPPRRRRGVLFANGHQSILDETSSELKPPRMATLGSF
jgi:hypothetical protein